jgi:peptidoglycan/xylan/chitin deacetylase (PgdA/CDA1 family)
VPLETYIRFVAGKRPRLPERPILITFDDARADSWLGADGTLERLGYTAVLFVDAGSVDSGEPAYMTWDELEQMQRSGRWNAQLHSGRGHVNIRYGPGENDVGPYYAYRGEGEAIEDWRERVKDDAEWGMEQMKEHIPGWQPLAFAPPYGNLGQVSTNDPEIPVEAQRWLSRQFDVAFVQDRSGFARPDGRFLQGRYQLTRAISGGELHAWLESAPGAR